MMPSLRWFKAWLKSNEGSTFFKFCFGNMFVFCAFLLALAFVLSGCRKVLLYLYGEGFLLEPLFLACAAVVTFLMVYAAAWVMVHLNTKIFMTYKRRRDAEEALQNENLNP